MVPSPACGKYSPPARVTLFYPGRALGARAEDINGFDEDRYQVGVEQSSGAELQVLADFVAGAGGVIGTHRGQRVVNVGDRQQAPLDRDVLALERVRIAGAVPALVVEEKVGDGGLQVADLAQDAGAGGRVLLHGLPFGGGERTGLVQDRVGDDDFAEVM